MRTEASVETRGEARPGNSGEDDAIPVAAPTKEGSGRAGKCIPQSWSVGEARTPREEFQETEAEPSLLEPMAWKVERARSSRVNARP
jgi:hypothetical protein